MVDLMRRSETRFFGEPFVGREDVAADWASPATDLATGSCGVWSGGDLAGYAETSRNRSYVAVDGAHTGRGIGTALTAWSERTLASHGHATAQQVVPEPDQAGAELVADRGYDVAWTSWALRLDAGDTIAHRDLGDGVVVRPFEPADSEATHVLIEDAFAEWITRERTTLEEWTIENLHREGSDPAHHHVATVAGEIVGASIVHDTDDTAWVYQLAVRRDRRGQGIAQGLMAASFEAARARGVPKAALGTDTRTGALGLYERLGMRVKATWQVWEKPLSPTGPVATS